MNSNVIMALFFLIFVSCGNQEQIVRAPTLTGEELITPEQLVATFSYPQANVFSFEDEIIADLSQSTPITSSFGTVSRGVTLNLVSIKGVEFLVYGEDGVFAAECEPSASFPTHGPTHPLCEVAHGESFDKIILCTSSNQNTSLMLAQNWPGVEMALNDNSLGMKCWINGTKMLSAKIFTY